MNTNEEARGASPLTPRMYTRNQVAQMTGLSVGTLANWAKTRKGPEFIKVNGYNVRYPETALVEWFKAKQDETDALRRAV